MKTKTSNTIKKFADRIRKLKKQGKAAGLFLEDRELLTCKNCGLMEDVSCDGRLLTYRKDSSDQDSGLRFKSIRKGVYACPFCQSRIPGS